jgi:hypothetical protein
VARIDTEGGIGASPLAMRSARKIRPVRVKAAGFATSISCRRTAGMDSSFNTNRINQAMSGLVRWRKGADASCKSVRSPQRPSATPAKSPNGVGRVDIRIR